MFDQQILPWTWLTSNVRAEGFCLVIFQLPVLEQKVLPSRHGNSSLQALALNLNFVHFTCYAEGFALKFVKFTCQLSRCCLEPYQLYMLHSVSFALKFLGLSWFTFQMVLP